LLSEEHCSTHLRPEGSDAYTRRRLSLIEAAILERKAIRQHSLHPV